MACSSGCPTPGAHSSWGECVRSKNLQTADVTAHQFNQSIYRTQDEYRKARGEGLQPESVTMKDINFARKMTDITGKPYRADQAGGGLSA